MSKDSNNVVITVGPRRKPYAKIIRAERRIGMKDRRRLRTYISNDRRGGKTDRRKPMASQVRRLRTGDRRQLNIYIATDRRSGIADRRKKK